MVSLLMLPWVFWNECLDILMTLIPRRLWDALWHDARRTHSGAVAEATDAGLRVALSILVLVVAGVLWSVL